MKKTKVLIVEDEVIVAMDLRNTLTKLEFIVTDTISDGNDVLNSIDENEPDIILMDINLGQDKDGIEIVKDIYAVKYIPIIYLTGFYDDEMINRAVKTNPVGYLIKPYNKQELKATIILGVYKNKKIKNITIDKDYKYLGFNYYYDFKEQQLYYQEIHIKLGKKEIKLLEFLILSEGKDLSFKMIEYEIWQNNTITKEAIRVLVHRLRVKLDGKFIQSIPYFGYRFEG